MPKTAVSQWDNTPANNQDINGIGILGSNNISNGDNAFREIMAQIAVTPLHETASVMRTNLGSTAVGDAVFIATSPAVARTSLRIKHFCPQDTDATAGQGNAVTDTAAVQAWMTEISTNEYEGARWEGDYLLNSGMVLGPAAGTIPTLHIAGMGRFYSNAAMTTLLEIRNSPNLRVSDQMWLTGTGGTSNASRTTYEGLLLSGTTNRAKFADIKCEYFGAYGVSQVFFLASGYNLNLNVFGQINAYDCGSGYSGVGYTGNKTATFSARSDTGTTGSFGQRSVLTVTAFPPTQVTSRVAAGNGPLFAWISGRLYLVMAVGGSTIDVFPWIDSGVTAGSIDYIYGGAFLASGSDANLANIRGIDAVRCGIGFADCALYGGVISGQLHNNLCGIGHAFGIPLSSSSKGGFVGLYYGESNNLFDAAQITSLTSCNRMWGSVGPYDEAKIVKVAAPRASTAGFPTSPTYSMKDGLAHPEKNVFRAYEPTWETITSTAFNSAQSVDFTGLGDYNEVEFSFEDCTFAAACSLLLRLSNDNGATFSASGYQSTAANNDVGTTSTTSFALTDGTVTTMPYGKIRLTMTKDEARRTQCEGILGGVHKVGGIFSTAGKNDAFRIIFNAQNWTAGNIVVRGLR